ncbi:hypothetical protein [Actinospica robiniae]|uniref:hypothetical protein n=1 Tax=Actinospica robiniae TaxID=304901 RepID=UPI00042009E2|nr:hypothetical protein [Actinospica robiniae]
MHAGQFDHVAVPVALAAVALVDAAFAGFRAATGRNARIEKRRYNLRAAVRGLAIGAASLAVVAAVLGIGLLGTHDAGHAYDALVQAGHRMLMVLMPFAAAVVVSLAGYWLLPMRESTFVILVGLGPFTLARPLVVLAAAALALHDSHRWLVWAGTLLASGGVLLVEPWVHRRWYHEPL